MTKKIIFSDQFSTLDGATPETPGAALPEWHGMFQSMTIDAMRREQGMGSATMARPSRRPARLAHRRAWPG
ncbi:hypothetical protein BN2497_11433 [Janthinobacterium sp. CG23_2]|nr:hypothetical protein BN2497_11433 [Janthinobacterium sp. CG23_2]CUU32114.1 hypothetical protein BN3177_11433 [Janthinobacterium sp. CG23_2]